jgi:hypothetical protein
MSHADFISKMIESESRVDATGLVRHNDFGESRHGTNYAEQVAAALQLAAAAKFESRSGSGKIAGGVLRANWKASRPTQPI